MNSPRMRLPGLLAFAGIGFPATLLAAPIFSVLPSFYVLHTKADLASIGSMLLVARIIDAVFDPVLGILSDRTRSRFGPRLPWIVAGVAVALPAAWFLFLPPPGATALYFFAASTTAFIGWTMISIPHNAWAAELSDDYDQRSRIFGVKNVVATIGGFSFFLIPPALAPFIGTTEITSKTLQCVIGLIYVTMAIALFALVKSAPVRPADTKPVHRGVDLAPILRSVTQNKPLLMFIAVTVLVGVSTGMSTALAYLYMKQMGLEPWFFLTAIFGAVASVLSVPLWTLITARWGKHRPWAASIILSGLAGLAVFFLAPGKAALAPLLGLFLATGLLAGVSVAIPSSMLADIADYERLRSGENAVGNYFALLVLLSKFNAAIGGAAGFWVAQALGYKPGLPGLPIGLLVAFAAAPASMSIAAGLILLRYPIDRRRQAVISRRLVKRAAQTEVTIQP